MLKETIKTNPLDLDKARIKALLEQQEAFKKELIEQQKDIHQLREELNNVRATVNELDIQATKK